MGDPTGPAGQLAQMVAQAVQQGLSPVSARLAAIEDECERTGNIVNGLVGHLGLRAEQQAGEPADETKVDTFWGCRKCGTRLGMYDAKDDVMRLRYKEFIAHAHIGIGGWVRVVCKGCAELNVVEYTTGVAEQDGMLHQIQVGGDRLLVDEPLLLHLLDLVRGNDGRLVLQLVQAPAPSPQ